MHEIFCVDRQSSDLVAYNVLAIFNCQFSDFKRISRFWNFEILIFEFWKSHFPAFKQLSDHEIFCVDRQWSDLVVYNVLEILNIQFIANIRILKRFF